MIMDTIAMHVGYAFMWFYGLIFAAAIAWRIANRLFPAGPV